MIRENGSKSPSKPAIGGLASVALALLLGCSCVEARENQTGLWESDRDEIVRPIASGTKDDHLTTEDSIGNLVHHPAFRGLWASDITVG